MPVTETKPVARVTSLSIAAPAYNEGGTIGSIVNSWVNYLSKLPQLKDYEIVVCNDGSKDNTGEELSQLAAANPCVKPVTHVKNQGAAAALTNAIRNTHCKWVLLIDSDGQYGIENIDKLIAQVEQDQNTLAVIGVRTRKQDSAFTRFGSWMSGWLCNAFHGTHYRDFNCAFKLVDGDVLRSLSLEAKGLNYSGEVSSKLIERGVTLKEAEVEHKARDSGRSSAQNLRAAWHRLLFVSYIGYRQLLLRHGVLQVDKCQ